MKRYAVNFYRSGGLVTTGHGMAANADEAIEKAEFALLCKFSRIDLSGFERVEAFVEE